MNRSFRILLPAVLALAATASLTHAQTPPSATGARPSLESLQRMQDDKIATLKSTLKMSDAQLQLWAPVETQLRTNQAARIKAMQDWATAHDTTGARPSNADRHEHRGALRTERAERYKALAALLGPFEQSLTTDQKTAAGPLLADLEGAHHRHGRRAAAHQGRGAVQQ